MKSPWEFCRDLTIALEDLLDHQAENEIGRPDHYIRCLKARRVIKRVRKALSLPPKQEKKP